LTTKPTFEPGGNTFAEMVGHNATPETVDAAREADTLALELARALARADALRIPRVEEGAVLDFSAEQEMRRDIRAEEEAPGHIAEQQESYPLPPPRIRNHTVNPLDLTDEERETLAVLLREKIRDDPFPLSSRLAPLRAILTKVEPPTARAVRPLLPSGMLNNRKKSRR
jgi:hypothetical protein